MGKKSRRTKEINNPSPARILKDSIVNLLQSTDILYETQNWKGIVSHEESLETEFLQVFDGALGFLYHYSSYYFQVAVSYMELGNSKKAIVYFEKTIETTTKASATKKEVEAAYEIRQKCESCLTDCYLAESRYSESIVLFRKLHRPQTLYNPRHFVLTLDFLSCLQLRGEHELALELTEEYMEEQKQVLREENTTTIPFQLLKVIGRCHQELNDFHKAIATFKEILESCPNEMSDTLKQTHIFSNLGRSYASIGDIVNAKFYLERVMLHLSKNKSARSDLLEAIFHNIADIHFRLEGHEGEAIQGYGKSLELLQENEVHPSRVGNFPNVGPEHTRGIIYRNLGLVHLRLKEWDDAIMTLQCSINVFSQSEVDKVRDTALCISYQELGRTYLEQFFGDTRLSHNPKERGNVLNQALHFSQEALKLLDHRESSGDRSVFLDLAQENFLLGDTHQAHEMLKQYLDFAVHVGPQYCQACHQSSPKEDMMQVCSGCSVAAFCSCDHQTQAWKKDRIGHKKICNLLKTWRNVKKGKRSVESCQKLFDKFFFSISKRVKYSYPAWKKEAEAEGKVQERDDMMVDISRASSKMCLMCID